MEEWDAKEELLFKNLAKAIETAKIGTFVVDRDRTVVMETAYEVCKRVFPKAEVTLTYHQPLPTAGYVRIIGENLECNMPKLLSLAMRAATNIDIWPMVDGTISVDLTFYGTAKPM